jgi:hypothetical protein
VSRAFLKEKALICFRRCYLHCLQIRAFLAAVCHPITRRDISQSSGEPEIGETKFVKEETNGIVVFPDTLIYTAKMVVNRHIIL